MASAPVTLRSETTSLPPDASTRSSDFALPPLSGEWLRELSAPSAASASKRIGTLALPLGATHARPLIVGVHAAASRPDWLCSQLRQVYGPHVFVVCPHPTEQLSTMASWSSAEQIRERVVQALQAVYADYGVYVDRRSMTYFGHSQGAMMMPYAFRSALLPGPVSDVSAPLRFTTVVLFEGLPRDYARANFVSDTLHAVGAQQVYLVSGQAGWAGGHQSLAASLRAHGFQATHVSGSFGHFFNAESLSLLRAALPQPLDEVSTP
jgi:predicted esterase